MAPSHGTQAILGAGNSEGSTLPWGLQRDPAAPRRPDLTPWDPYQASDLQTLREPCVLFEATQFVVI